MQNNVLTFSLLKMQFSTPITRSRQFQVHNLGIRVTRKVHSYAKQALQGFWRIVASHIQC